MARRTPAEIQRQKKEEIERMFSKAAPLVRDRKKVESLKDNSSLKKICVAIIQYLNGNFLEGCTGIYHHFRIRPYRTSDMKLTDSVKEKLHELQRPSKSQLKMF